jgi:hypothetical protein
MEPLIAGGIVPEAPVDGSLYVRQNAQWVVMPQAPGTYNWTYSDNTNPDPNSGQLRFNEVPAVTLPAMTPLALTAAYFHKTSGNGADTSTVFPKIFTAGRHVVVQEKDDATKKIEFDISGAPVDSGTFWTVNITAPVGFGSSIGNNQDVIVGVV